MTSRADDADSPRQTRRSGPAVSSSDVMLSVDEAAELLDVHKSTVYRYVHEGTLRAWRVGPKRIRIRVADLQTLVEPIPAEMPRWWPLDDDTEPVAEPAP